MSPAQPHLPHNETAQHWTVEGKREGAKIRKRQEVMVLHLWKAARSRAHFCTLAHKHGSTPSVDGGIAAFSCAERLVTVVHVEENSNDEWPVLP